MFYFKGSSCSLCGQALKETDDIVACPVCGSPHHRSCYKENGGCANESLHEEGFSWKRDTAAEEAENDAGEKKSIYCGICGAENAGGRLYCHNCGRPLFDDAAGGQSEYSEYGDFNRQHYDFSDKEQIDGVPMGDLKRFLGSGSMMYAPMFYHMSKLGKKVCFNLFGLIFPSFWFLTRKMYTHGIVIVLYNTLSYCYSKLFFGVYEQMYNAAVKFDSDKVMALFQEQPVIMGGFMGIGLLSYVIAIITALYGNHMYKKWSIKKIKRLRTAANGTEEYHSALEASSRSGFGVALLILLLYVVATLVIDQLLPTII